MKASRGLGATDPASPLVLFPDRGRRFGARADWLFAFGLFTRWRFAFISGRARSDAAVALRTAISKFAFRSIGRRKLRATSPRHSHPTATHTEAAESSSTSRQ
jgi:hypothetical protein